MTHVFTSLLLVACLAASNASAKESYELLFAKSRGALTKAEMKLVSAALGYVVSSDGKGLEDSEGCGAVDFETRVVDLNEDGQPEVIVTAGNTCTSGITGSSVFLFVKGKAGRFEMNLGFPAADLEPLASKSLGFPDLLIGGRGFCHPVWRWNGRKYGYHCAREEKSGDCASREGVKLCTGR